MKEVASTTREVQPPPGQEQLVVNKIEANYFAFVHDVIGSGEEYDPKLLVDSLLGEGGVDVGEVLHRLAGLTNAHIPAASVLQTAFRGLLNEPLQRVPIPGSPDTQAMDYREKSFTTSPRPGDFAGLSLREYRLPSDSGNRVRFEIVRIT